MKVISLLNKISNGKRPEKIKYKDKVYNWDKNVGNYILNDDKNVSINWDYVSMFALEEKVEIIEEDKKIEKIMRIDTRETRECIITFQNKINEIIDKINKEK